MYSIDSAATLARPDLVGAEVGENLLRGFRLLGQNELQMVAERVFDGDDKLIRHANAVGERADDRARLAQRGQGARAETFVRPFELLEHVQARTFLGLRLQKLVLLGGRRLQFHLEFAQPVLPLLDRAALGLRVQFLNLDARGEFLQARFEPGALLFESALFRRKAFRAGCCCPAFADRAR